MPNRIVKWTGIVSVLVLALGLYGCQPKRSCTFTVASYNLRNANAGDSAQGDGWGQRCVVMADLIRFHGFDLFGTQEGLKHQLDTLKNRLPDFDYIGVGRDDGGERGEHAAIFYHTSRFELLDHGDFWLSQTPDTPSVGWDAVLPRICTWGHFKDKESSLEFLFFNLHMDHIGKEARVESAYLVQQKMKELGKGLPVILTGDFNVDQTHRSYRALTESGALRDAFEAARLRYAPNGTFNGFAPNSYTRSRIDHVFVSPDFQVQKYGVLTDSYRTVRDDSGKAQVEDCPEEIDIESYQARIPSDHFPVMVVLETPGRH